jgi:type II secretory pathway component PulF
MENTLGALGLLLLAMPGLALVVVARTLFPAQKGQRPEMQQLLRMAGGLLLLLALTGATFGLVGFVAIPAIPSFLVVVLMIVDRYRRGEHQALLFTLAAGARRWVPLSESARAFADENGGDTSTRASILADCLDRGMSLRQAVRQARLKLTTASKLAIRLGEALGDLGNVLFQSLGDVMQIDAALRATVAKLFYLFAVLTTGTSVIAFVMLKIVPIFQRMFSEFGLKLPAPTVLLIHISNSLSAPAAVFAAPVLVLVLAFFVISVLYFIGWLPADIPGLNWFSRRYDNALVLRGLGLCVRRHIELPRAIELLGKEFPRSSTARRLRKTRSYIEQGHDWRVSMLQADLLTEVEAAVLASAERAGNLAWALDEMADSLLRRHILWIQVRYQIAFPIVLLVMGGIVGFIVVSLFLPLVALIQGLS